MKIEELHTMTFEEAMDIFLEDDCFTTIDTLKEFAIECINDNRFGTAADILNEIKCNRYADFYRYDYSCTSFNRPVAILCLKDLEYYCENYFEYYTKLADESEKKLIAERKAMATETSS